MLPARSIACALYHSLVLLRRNYRPKHVELIEIITKIIVVASSWLFIILKCLIELVAAKIFNPLNAELNPICHLLALLGAHHIFHISRIRVKLYSSAAF